MNQAEPQAASGTRPAEAQALHLEAMEELRASEESLRRAEAANKMDLLSAFKFGPHVSVGTNEFPRSSLLVFPSENIKTVTRVCLSQPAPERQQGPHKLDSQATSEAVFRNPRRP